MWIGKRFWYALVEPDFGCYHDVVSRTGFEVTASVESTFKGAAAREVRFLTGRGGGDCGFPFQKDRRYLLYLDCAFGRGLSVVTICGRTREIGEAGEDLKFLRPISPAVRGPGRAPGSMP
jgi:hypothetical protein